MKPREMVNETGEKILLSYGERPDVAGFTLQSKETLQDPNIMDVYNYEQQERIWQRKKKCDKKSPTPKVTQ